MRRTALTAVCAIALGITVVAVPPVPAETVASGSVAVHPQLSVSPSAGKVRVRTLRPADLPRGQDARIAWLQQGVIHTPEGKSIKVRIPHAKQRQSLLGISGEEYVVASWRKDVLRAHRVQRGSAPTRIPRLRFRYSQHDRYYGLRLSRDGAQISRVWQDRAATALGVHDARTGKRVPKVPRFVDDLPLDFDAGHLVIRRSDQDVTSRVQDWEPTVGARDLSTWATGAFLRHDVLFRGAPRTGPTSISAPGPAPWRADFVPLDISPDGTLVLGTRGDVNWRAMKTLQLRRMSDGAVLQKFAYGQHLSTKELNQARGREQSARFETSKSFVFELTRPRGSVLVRCNLSGKCRRASGWGGRISFAHEQFFW